MSVETSRPRIGPVPALGGHVIVSATLLLLLLAVRFAYYANDAVQAIAYPFELDYGEGILISQYKAMLAHTMYSPFGEYPFIVFHYPPLYYVVTFLATNLAPTLLSAGRAVSVASTVGVALCVFALTRAAAEPPRSWLVLVGSACGAGLVVAFFPVYSWSQYMRVDMVAALLAIAGLGAVRAAMRDQRWLYAAAVLFVAAVFAKQTSIGAPLAGFGLALVLWPKAALRALALAVALGLVVLGALFVLTDGNIVKHMFLYNINRFSRSSGFRNFRFAWGKHPLILLADLVFIGLFARMLFGEARRGRDLRAALRTDPRLFTFALCGLYFLACMAISVTAFKSGAAVNYFVEASVASAWLGGLIVSWVLDRRALDTTATSAPALRVAMPWIVVVLAVQTAVTMLQAPSGWTALPSLRDQQATEDVLALIRAAPGEVLSEDMTLLNLAGKQVPWEPSIITELTYTGVFDQRKVTRLITAQRFDLVIVTTFGDSRFTPSVRRAITQSYRETRTLGPYHVYERTAAARSGSDASVKEPARGPESSREDVPVRAASITRETTSP